MALNWQRKKAKILVSNRTGVYNRLETVEKSVTGRSTGVWCVHKNASNEYSSGEGWVVTHTPTGRSLMKLPSQSDCVEMVEYIAKGVFGFTHYGVDRMKQRRAEIEERIGGWCKEKRQRKAPDIN